MRLRSSEKFRVILITMGLGRLRPIEEELKENWNTNEPNDFM